MICTSCKRRLKADAVTCLCGWSATGSQAVRAVIACCVEMCPEGAICRIFTKTGWANVCRTHYPTIERASYSVNSPVMKAARAAYEKSYDYRRRHGLEKVAPSDRSALEAELAEVKRRMEAAAPQREPGQDDDDPLAIAADPQAYLDRAQA